MPVAAWISISGIGLTLALQMVALIIWGAMLEMRMRYVEGVCKEMREVRDMTLAIKKDLEFICNDLKNLSASIEWMKHPAEYDFAPNARHPRKPGA